MTVDLPGALNMWQNITRSLPWDERRDRLLEVIRQFWEGETQQLRDECDRLRALCGEAADVYEAETVTNPAVVGRPIADWRRKFIQCLRAAAKGGEDGR